MELTDTLKAMLIETARALKGYERRRFMARIVKELGPGGQRLAERELGWSRVTIRKGLHELESDHDYVTRSAPQGRLRAEDYLPYLLVDICALVEQQRRANPHCCDDPQRACLSAAEVRRRLIAECGYNDAELPTVQTIAAKLKVLGYLPSRPGRSQQQTRSRGPPYAKKWPIPGPRRSRWQSRLIARSSHLFLFQLQDNPSLYTTVGITTYFMFLHLSIAFNQSCQATTYTTALCN